MNFVNTLKTAEKNKDAEKVKNYTDAFNGI
jgi:hypothetical protein